MPTCGKHSEKESQSLGEILSGESIYVLDYEAKVLKNNYCELLCFKKLNNFDVDLLKWTIEHEYVSSWYLDDLPAGRNLTMYGEKSEIVLHDSGIPVGYHHPRDNTHLVYNHFTFNILYFNLSRK